MTDGDAATAARPGCLVLLVQASGGMAAGATTPYGTMPLGGFARFCADHLFDSLAGSELPFPLEVTALGYRAGADGVPAVVPLLPSGTGFARFDTLTPPDSVEEGQPRPWTADPGADGDPAATAGLAEAYRLVAGWLAGRAAPRPPVVVHCTDGTGVGADYERVAASLRLLTPAPRLVHWCVTPDDADPPPGAWPAVRRASAVVAVAADDGAPAARPAMGVNEYPVAETWAALFDEPADPPPAIGPAADPFVVARQLTAPKRGNAEAEWEDGYAVDPATGAAAVTDGAGEGIFCRVWAGLLARRFVADRPDLGEPTTAAKWLATNKTGWRQEINYPGLRYTQQNKVNDVGAAATLVGLTVGVAGDDGEARWAAAAVGDACLFWVRAGRLMGTFPLAVHAHLNSTPALFRTKTGPAPRPLTGGGTCRPGDLFLLATDATAGALFRAAEEGTADWERYAELDDEPWRAEVADLRTAGRMVNDDCTLVVLRVAAGRPAAAEPAAPPTPPGETSPAADATDGDAPDDRAPQPAEAP